MRPVAVLLLGDDCVCEMRSAYGMIFWYGDMDISPVAGNARRGSHCIGIVFLCQEWRLWGLFFAERNFAMKLMLSPIRQNAFLAADHSAFLELLTLQKGPLAPFSVTTPLFGRNGRFGGARRRCACSSSAARRQSPGSVARRLRPVAAPDARVFLLSLAPLRSRNAPPAPCGRMLFPYRRMPNPRWLLLPPHVESSLRFLRR